MEFGLTTSTIKRAKVKKLEPLKEDDYRFIWEVNYANICEKKMLIIVHVDTRYSMIYTDIKPSIWKNLNFFLNSSVELALRREGFSSDEIKKYFSIAGDAFLTKTHGAKASGGMKHLTTDLPYFEKILVDGMFQPFITDYVNDELCNIAIHPNEKYFNPREFFVRRIKELLDESTSSAIN